MVEDRSSGFDANNRQTWQLASTIATFSATACWTDPGEAEAIGVVAMAVKDQPILDVGVGAGRTADIFREVSTDYIGVDYTPEMIERSRLNHPDLHFEVCDVRDLSRFRDQQFGLVNFSFNGIDAVPHADRSQAIAEMFRVTRVGGSVLYSTLNKDGILYTARPWAPPGFPVSDGARWSHLVRHPTRVARHVAGLIWQSRRSSTPFRRGLKNWRELRRLAEDHDTWAVGVLDAHDFGVVCHFTTLSAAIDEIVTAGYVLREIYDKSGQTLSAEQEASGTEWFHMLAVREK